MNNQKTTKRSLVAAGLVLLLCIAMLVGTTFAWFTDSASTGVNKIQAGTLDIELQYATAWNEQGETTQWANAEGQTLNFKKAAGHENEPILWEPGCTYELPAIRILNKGNLALKYKLVITGIKGDAELNNAIVWTNGGTDELLSEYTGTMIPGENDNVTAPIVINGHMKEEAGNEYQGKSIEGIAITVVATQLAHEYDSNNNTYDANAQYPATSNAELENAITSATPGSTVALTSGTFNLPATAVNEGVTISGSGAEKTTVVTTENGYTVSNDNVTIKNVTVDGTAASSVYYSGAVNLKGDNASIENSVINGGGTGTWGASVYVGLSAGETAYIKNTKISGGFRGIFLGSQSGSVVVDNCDIDAVYPISVDGGGDFTVTVKNSRLHGWTSYSTITSATFIDTQFSLGDSDYDVVAAYTDTTFKNCTFDSELKIYAQTAGFEFVFENCTKNGVAVTAENFKTLFPADSDVWTECTCIVNGVQVTA